MIKKILQGGSMQITEVRSAMPPTSHGVQSAARGKSPLTSVPPQTSGRQGPKNDSMSGMKAK